jgi:hypothetical protein
MIFERTVALVVSLPDSYFGLNLLYENINNFQLALHPPSCGLLLFYGQILLFVLIFDKLTVVSIDTKTDNDTRNNVVLNS